VSVFGGVLLDELIKPGAFDYPAFADKVLAEFERRIEKLSGTTIPLPGGGSVRVIECESLGPGEIRLVAQSTRATDCVTLRFSS